MVFRLGEAVFASPGFAEVWPFARPVAAALILSVFIFVPLFFSHFVNEFAKPVPKTHIRVLLLRGLIVGTILGILTMAISHFSISPSEVQGVNLRLDSFRYRFGVWLDGINGPLCVFCAWPAFIYGVLGNGPLGYIGLFFCTLIAGFGWVMLWDKLRRAFTGFFKVPWARN